LQSGIQQKIGAVVAPAELALFRRNLDPARVIRLDSKNALPYVGRPNRK
jgi:hypothetical protein